MVDHVKQRLLRQIVTRTTSNRYIDQLHVRYAHHLLDDGPYKELLGVTKFEEFLWQVSKESSRDSLNDLLMGLYQCENNEYGPNHLAIALLFHSGRCKACFTTNFDNAIELACEAVGVAPDTYTEPGSYPNKLPEAGERPALIKLHGSATTRNCVAESAELLWAQSAQTHGQLRRLLLGQRVFVVGYSGLGDVDISGHLSRTEATFFWANHERPTRIRPAPDWADYFVISNLQWPTTLTNPNVLLELSEVDVRALPAFRSHQAADEVLAEWIQSHSFDDMGLVRAIYAWRRTEPIAHLDLERLAEMDIGVRLREYAWTCVQRRVYRTAYKAFARALETEQLSQATQLWLGEGQGFALWRQGDWEAARAYLMELLEYALASTADDQITIQSDLESVYSGICRVYLEVSHDLLQFVPVPRRSQLVEKWKIHDAMRLLRHLLTRRGVIGPENALLARSVLLNTEWLLGKDVSVEEITALLETSKNSQYPITTWTIVGFLLQRSFLEGLKEWRVMDQIFKEARIGHYRRKNLESLLTAILVITLRPFDMLGYYFARGLIRWFYRWRTDRDERRYREQIKEWSQWRSHWIETGEIKTVTN